jgi:hypothetical protein
MQRIYASPISLQSYVARTIRRAGGVPAVRWRLSGRPTRSSSWARPTSSAACSPELPLSGDVECLHVRRHDSGPDQSTRAAAALAVAGDNEQVGGGADLDDLPLDAPFVASRCAWGSSHDEQGELVINKKGNYVLRRAKRKDLSPLPDFHARRHTAAMDCEDARRRRAISWATRTRA